jgi:hypothetical protein
MPKVHRMGFKMDFFRRKLDKHTKMSDHTFAEDLLILSKLIPNNEQSYSIHK